MNGIKSIGYTPVYKLTEKSEVKTQSEQNTTPKTDTFTRSESEENITYEPPKKLTAEQIDALKRQVQESMQNLAKQMLGQQYEIAKTADGKVDFAALADDLGIGTTPEAAAEAISENGNWGVNAVSTRLIDMAINLSGGDMSKISMLREAVQKGFAQVGNLEDLPEVCQQTYDEVMKRFDYLEQNGSMEGYGQTAE
ncbi:MAG TPA: hypothetical protein H9746_02465 [Candidatus Butyricicoccus avistercoris]|uniref:Uncharacterized protein n=1 Tax=Candidatus Butyricicoccus avistercoris TaxID=2838518 RepID=A0A9D1PGL9_9FIRM|nr:hypothetical protein [Candidatus Butyricicoccus avistercoris]